MFYTYVLLSLADDKLYIGWSRDLANRIGQHEREEVPATKNRRPLKLIYYEACLEGTLAVLREKQLKTGFGRAYLKRRLNLD